MSRTPAGYPQSRARLKPLSEQIKLPEISEDEQTSPRSVVAVLERVALPQLINQEQTAAVLGVSEKTLSEWRYKRRNLPFIKMGSRIMYDVKDIEQFISSCKQEAKEYDYEL
ncbi:helix-turn-helix domain-containing protein [Microbacterium foliorum]|uniref:helix-turn-helix domain-containing protein n=1 Tax=Rothia terrae TaxID=396015 RepID=UPI00342C7FEC